MYSGELRIPNRLLSSALAEKKTKQLRLFAVAKLLHNSRVGIKELLEETDTHPRTGKRLIHGIVSSGWAGTDGKYLFPRAWHRMKYTKHGGLYLTNTEVLADLKKFEALAFSFSLQKLYRRKGPSTTKGTGAKPKDLSLRYVCEALQLKERRCKTLRSQAQMYGFISIHRRYWRVGKSSECGALTKYIKGPHLFAFKNNTLWTQVSRVTFNLNMSGQNLPDTPKERTTPKPETQTR